MMARFNRQPDDPGSAICPCCRQPWPDEDGDVEKFLRKNAGKKSAAELARFIYWPLERLNRFARKAKPPIDLAMRREKEPEPSGA